MSKAYFTVSELAERLGIAPNSIRRWQHAGLIDAPHTLPVSGVAVYAADAAAAIEAWYVARCAEGGTRGPGAAERQQAAQARIAEVAE